MLSRTDIFSSRTSGKHWRKVLQIFSKEHWLDMGMSTTTFMVHMDEQGRLIGDLWVLTCNRHSLDSDFNWLTFIKRHKDVLHNLGISGSDFVDQNQALVTGMTRKFLDYVKSAQLEATDATNSNSRAAESEWIEIWITPNGYPIIPKLVMEKNLKKAEWEKLLWAFLTQHYCKWTFRLNIN